jgi:hypothetical protein
LVWEIILSYKFIADVSVEVATQTLKTTTTKSLQQAAKNTLFLYIKVRREMNMNANYKHIFIISHMQKRTLADCLN